MTERGREREPGERPVQGAGLLGLLLVSAAVLLLQLVQTRIFSVMLWHHLTYLVVTFTLVGFAAGGTLLACRRSMLEGRVAGRLLGWSLAFAWLVVGAYALVTHQVATASPEVHTKARIATAALDYAVLVVPLVAAGLVVALALSSAGASVGRAYSVNMLGSALGCAIYVPLLRALGAEGTVLFACAMGAFGGVAFGRRGAGAPGRALALASGAAFLGSALLAPTAWFEVPVAPSKAMVEAMRANPRLRVVETRWDPLCRLDVVAPVDPASGEPSTRGEQWMIYQDGDAPTALPVGPAHERGKVGNKEQLAYLLFRDRAPKAVAIGVGGGIDILTAHWAANARPADPRVDFTGVEINRTTAALMRERFDDLTADRYGLPGVTIHVDEGRSWLRRTDERFDIIQMTGTDTYAALSSGSYVMSESYLYTAQAYDDFLAHLTEDGVISVLRFLFDPPRETLRLAAIAVDALRRDGATDPADHVVMLAFRGPRSEVDGAQVGLDYGAVLVAKRPFDERQSGIYQRLARSQERVSVLWAPHGEVTPGPVAEFFAAVRAGEEQAFRDSYLYNLDPVTDDQPFFFRYHRWRSLLGDGPDVTLSAGAPAGSEYSNIVGGEPIGLILLGTMLGESTLLVALLVVLPLVVFGRSGLAVHGAGRWVAYFFGLGAGYILVEIVAMQRFVLFLGHPGYAITVVLVTFLVFSGLGAAVAGRSMDPDRTRRRALVAIVTLIAALAFGLGPIFEAALAWDLSARVALSIALLAPPAFVMGMPFPSGLSLVHRQAAPLVSWAFGVNGGASVIASVVAILVAMAAGFSAAFGVAAGCYLLSLLATRTPSGEPA